MDALTNDVKIRPAKKRSPYSLKVVWNTIRHGLFLQGLRHGLSKLGIDIMPYYWVHEETIPTSEPKVRTTQNFTFKTLTPSELDSILDHSDIINEKKIHQSFKNGHKCVGLIHEENIAAYMFIELNSFEIKKRKFELNSNEAYLLNMYTLHDYRGKNLAPYLRYQCYRFLEHQGITTYYSVSNYFNKSAIKFKKKLNSRPLKLFMSIELFNAVQWNFRLKTYPELA